MSKSPPKASPRGVSQMGQARRSHSMVTRGDKLRVAAVVRRSSSTRSSSSGSCCLRRKGSSRSVGSSSSISSCGYCVSRSGRKESSLSVSCRKFCGESLEGGNRSLRCGCGRDVKCGSRCGSCERGGRKTSNSSSCKVDVSGSSACVNGSSGGCSCSNGCGSDCRNQNLNSDGKESANTNDLSKCEICKTPPTLICSRIHSCKKRGGGGSTHSLHCSRSESYKKQSLSCSRSNSCRTTSTRKNSKDINFNSQTQAKSHSPLSVSALERIRKLPPHPSVGTIDNANTYLISHLGPGLDEVLVKEIAKKICSAIEHLHFNGFVHRNVSVCSVTADQGVVRLCGLGYLAETDTLVRRNDLPVSWLSPEVVKLLPNESYSADPAQDSWQFGLLLFACLTGSLPWKIADRNDPGYKSWLDWCKKSTTKVPQKFKPLSPRFARLLRRLLQHKPELRSPVCEVKKYLQDSWVEGGSQGKGFKKHVSGFIAKAEAKISKILGSTATTATTTAAAVSSEGRKEVFDE